MTEETLFQKIISVDNLRKAWIKAYQFARTEDAFFDEYAYSVFFDHLEARLLLLSKELSEGNYKPLPLRYITIPKGAKERKIYFLSPRDTVVIQAVINVIGSDFEQTFINESYGYRLNINYQESKDVYHSWQEKYSEYVATVRGFVKHGLNSYYLITDIENYYPTISQDWLIGLISSKVDALTLKLIELFIRNTVVNSVEEIEPLSGIPAGVIYSHFFANIYLNDFDHLAQKLTLGYARYVDDICLVCGSLEELEKVKKELSDYLERWNQKFKEFEKTTIQPIYNIEPLLEHTRKMKYAVRLDIFETHEESSDAISMVQETEKPFYRLYKIAEREGDLSQIVNQAGLVIALLKTEREVDLTDVIYSLLETHPVRPSTLKAALIYLLESEHPKPSKRFMDFFFGEQKKSDYILTLFLRLLPHFDWEDDFRNEILSLCKSQSYLVRATAYFTLAQKEISFSEEQFGVMVSDEKSVYAKARLLDCLCFVSEPLNPSKFLSILEDEHLSVPLVRSFTTLIAKGRIGKEFINTLWAYIKDKQVSLDLLLYIFYLSSFQGFYWITEEIVNSGKGSEVRLVAPSISLGVINELASKSEIIQLVSFANQVRKLGFVDSALVGYFEASSKSGSQLSSDISSVVENVEKNAGLPSWISNSATIRQIYKQLSGDQEYLCQYLDDGNGKTAILEIVSIERIKSGGFSSYDEWETFLNNLSASKVIPRIYLAKYSEYKFACLYEIPEGFSTIANIMANEYARESFSQSNIFSLGEKLLKFISEIQRPNFHIHTIDPLSILWNPLNGTAMLLCIGGNLGTGKYYCGIQGCKTPLGEDEVGVSAAAYNFGLLILQLLQGSCSLEKIKNVKSKYYGTKLPDVLSALDVLPHYKMILGRLLNSEPNKRYTNLTNLLADYKQANKFRSDLEQITQQEEGKLALTLVDFILFRLRVISRNPNLKSDSSVWRSKAIIDELANTLQYLPEKLLKYWNVGLENNHQNDVFPQAKDMRMVSLEGRRLMDVAYGWEKLCRQYELKDDNLTPLARVFLYRCVVIETIASFSGFMTALSTDQLHAIEQRLTKFSDTVDSLIVQKDSEKEFTLRALSNDYKIYLSKKDLFEIRQLLNWRSKIAVSRESISSLKVFGVFWSLVRCNVEVIVDERTVDTLNLPTLIKSKNSLDEKSIWILLGLLPAMDKQVSSFQDFFEDISVTSILLQNDVWHKFTELQKCVMGLNPAKRKIANIHNYQVQNYKGDASGLLEYGWLPFKKTKVFDTRHLYISGNPALFEQKLGRPVLVDLVNSSKQSLSTVSSILAPAGRLTELPFKKRSMRVFGIKEFIRVYQKMLTFASVAIFGLLGFYIAELVTVSQEVNNSSSTNPAGAALGMFFGFVFSSFGEKFLKEIYPEDNDIIIGQTKKMNLRAK